MSIVGVLSLFTGLFRQEQNTDLVIARGELMTLRNASDMNETRTFLSSDNVCVKGSKMKSNASYSIFVFANATITDGMGLPASVTTVVGVRTDTNGGFSATLVWPSPLVTGTYDIIADCEEFGVPRHYDSFDAIADHRIQVVANFVVPEIILGTAAAMLAFLAAAYFMHIRPIKNRDRPTVS
jgi:hypothetical protein